MSESMENKTAAIYLRRSTEDDGIASGRPTGTRAWIITIAIIGAFVVMALL